MKKYRFVIVFLLLACLPAGAAAVYLDNGKVITGTIVEINVDRVVLQSQGERLEIPMEKVETIDLSDRHADLRRRNAALVFKHPIYTLAMVCGKEIGLSLEGQTALTRRLALNLRGAFYTYSVDYGDPAWSVALAPQIRAR